jgi:hypothetical protein
MEPGILPPFCSSAAQAFVQLSPPPNINHVSSANDATVRDLRLCAVDLLQAAEWRLCTDKSDDPREGNPGNPHARATSLVSDLGLASIDRRGQLTRGEGPDAPCFEEDGALT